MLGHPAHSLKSADMCRYASPKAVQDGVRVLARTLAQLAGNVWAPEHAEL